MPYPLRLRVPGVYLTWAIPVYLAFFTFSRMNNYAPSKSLLVRSPPPLPTILFPVKNLLLAICRGDKKVAIRKGLKGGTKGFGFPSSFFRLIAMLCPCDAGRKTSDGLEPPN